MKSSKTNVVDTRGETQETNFCLHTHPHTHLYTCVHTWNRALLLTCGPNGGAQPILTQTTGKNPRDAQGKRNSTTKKREVQILWVSESNRPLIQCCNGAALRACLGVQSQVQIMEATGPPAETQQGCCGIRVSIVQSLLTPSVSWPKSLPLREYQYRFFT